MRCLRGADFHICPGKRVLHRKDLEFNPIFPFARPTKKPTVFGRHKRILSMVTPPKFKRTSEPVIPTVA